MIDLGLPSGLKWADRNVGAVNVHDYGDYFMWGSTEPDTDNVCDWAHAPFNDGSEKFCEAYFNEHKSEWLTEDDTLKSMYDAAHKAMGGSWRMPTETEIRELLDGTTWSNETLGGVKGMRFTSKTNGNSIFIPFCGYRYGSDVGFVGDFGYAWSSSLCAGYADSSHSLFFSRLGFVNVFNSTRYYGIVVRGVHE